MKKTLAKLLRERKTIANNIKTSDNRINRFAITEEGAKIDFCPMESLKAYQAGQFSLRENKTRTIFKTISLKVLIPENAPVPEAGQEVSIYQAILIRDDLKSQKTIMERLIATDENTQRLGYGDNAREIKRQRNFKFEEILSAQENIQEAIDSIDALIQYVDNITEIS